MRFAQIFNFDVHILRIAPPPPWAEWIVIAKGAFNYIEWSYRDKYSKCVNSPRRRAINFIVGIVPIDILYRGSFLFIFYGNVELKQRFIFQTGKLWLDMNLWKDARRNFKTAS